MGRKTYRRKNKRKSRRRGGAAANENGLSREENEMITQFIESGNSESLSSDRLTQKFLLELLKRAPSYLSSKIIDLINPEFLADDKFVIRAVMYCPQILECTNYDVIAMPGFVEAVYKTNPFSIPYLSLHDAAGQPNDLHDELLNGHGDNGIQALENIIKCTTMYNDEYLDRH
jgi:hypothetical protein